MFGQEKQDDFIGGQPLFTPKRKNDQMEWAYRMGRTTAALDEQMRQVMAAQQIQQVQQIMLTKQQMDIATKFNDMANMLESVRSMKDEIKASQMPPLPPEVGPPGMLPPPLPGADLAGGMPPLPQDGEMGGMPPPMPASYGQAPPLMLG